MPRTHDRDECTICVELPRLARFGLPIWSICDQLGKPASALHSHTRHYPHLAAELSAATRDALRAAAYARPRRSA